MNVRVSEQLDNAIFSTMENRVPCTYTIDCTLANSDTGYELQIDLFTGMSINQSFTENYSDQFNASVELRPKDFLAVLLNYTGLTCTLILTTINAKTFYPYEEIDPIIFTGRVIIDNPQDLMKKYNFKQLIAEDEETNTSIEAHKAIHLPLSFQIMRQETYDLRRKEVNAMFTDTSMDKVLSYVTDQFGIDTTNIKIPDNVDKVKNLVIPPGQDISSVFHFLQERYGIFGNGLGAYLTDKTLHLYPSNDTEASDYPNIMHVIKAPDSYIPGDEGYHAVEGGEISIVIIGGGDVKNLTEAGVEQVGNSQVTLQADRLIDHTSKINSEGDVKLNENIQNLSLDTDRQAQANAVNTRYSGETVNSYNQLSNMGQFDCVMVTVGWVAAQPILMNPGQKVKYHYDDNDGVYTSASGILQGISYTTSKLDRYSGPPFYLFGSQIVMKLKPDKKS